MAFAEAGIARGDFEAGVGAGGRQVAAAAGGLRDVRAESGGVAPDEADGFFLAEQFETEGARRVRRIGMDVDERDRFRADEEVDVAGGEGADRRGEDRVLGVPSAGAVPAAGVGLR